MMFVSMHAGFELAGTTFRPNSAVWRRCWNTIGSMCSQVMANADALGGCCLPVISACYLLVSFIFFLLFACHMLHVVIRESQGHGTT